MSNARSLSRIFSLSSVVSALLTIGQQGATPTGAVMDYALSSPPPGWILCEGLTLLPDTPHQALRSALIADGFPHGQDGSGNPKIPDARGRTTAGKDNMGGAAAGRLTTAGSGIDGAALGATGGAETHTLSTPQLPSHSHTITDPGHAHANSGGGNLWGYSGANTLHVGTPETGPGSSVSISSNTTGISVNSAGSGQGHNNTQPTLVLNKIIKT